MKKLIRYYFLIISIIFSCSKGNIKEENIVASINDNNIYINDVDKLAEQELYDELCRFYMIRKTTLDFLINEKLLSMEAKRVNKTTEQILEDFYRKKINPKNLELYIKTNQLQDGIPDLKRGLRYVNPYSDEGKQLLIYNYKRYLKKALIDSLRKINNIQIFLKPPVAPNIELATNLIIHYRGNMSSKISFIELSDFENGLCQKSYAITDSIFKKYKDKVKFGFTHFSSYPTICTIASECAARQNKFWEMYDVFSKLKILPDTNEVYRIAETLDLDMKQFDNDFHSQKLIESINNNFDNIRAMGLYGSPTYIIDGRIIFNSASRKEMEEVLEQMINKK
jgi:hypothetical protein